jgi:uncharacterized glyoxalase superfamily protein PhnB
LAFTLTESETGYDLVFYVRARKLVIVLVNPAERRALRPITRGVVDRPNAVTITVTLTVDTPTARQGHPLYVDFKGSTIFTVDYMNDQIDAFLETIPNALRSELEDLVRNEFDNIRDKLIEETREVFTEQFGKELAIVSDVSGIEYKAGRALEANDQDYPEMHWIQIWHHFKNDQQEEVGDREIG